ncbi:hypothetical protein GC173_16735 [bacterium]|nr:hypothetical protein [bacterium]
MNLSRDGWRLIVAVLLLLCVVAPCSTAHGQETGDPADDTPGNALKVLQPMQDRTVVFEGAAAWDSATTSTLVRIDTREPARLLLADERPKVFPRRGTWVSPVIESDFPVTEVLPSWNVEAPENTGAVFDLRVRDRETKEWSDYLYMGQWGRTIHYPARTLEYDGGEVIVDILHLERAADAVQVRARLYSFNLGEWKVPALRRLTVVYSGPLGESQTPPTIQLPPRPEEGWNIPVPFTPQGDNPSAIAGSTCSPTSTRMVMAYRGVTLPLTDVALGIYDPEYGIFGTWNRAVAFAGQNGLSASLTRIRNWDQVEQYLSQGQPIIASIRFRKGEFPENVIKSSNGHLIVVRGMTKEGDLIINDPASKENGEGIVYTRESLKKAWLDKGGVGYLIGAPVNRIAEGN